ncbi:lysozyme inhibitor LprI family protein [Luteibacter aegosomaticola]|uniref:lysozyme inhibitor LprI family protein n=1 Tax=Luteibacter aegosomaticola TaxID=2911538 RepID=UPI001FFB2E36|nr:lysozyme inhibitor LprI family protein [Luteibacter aegosomaticola]UPG90965.1 lysozyme inhibitor LprI family protein [Luteibacter aegosomaticola]
MPGFAIPQAKKENGVRKSKAGFGLVLALVAPWAHGAGFDCAKAGTGVEKAICASPKVSALDGQLGDVFRAALKNHPGQAELLKLDQRHWLAERDATLSAYPSVKEAESGVLALYKARMNFLRGLDDTTWPKPFDALRPALAKLPTSGVKIPADFAKAGVDITLSEDVPLEKADAFPWQADANVRDGLKDLESYGGYRKLAGSPISSVWSLGGTAHCWTEVPFRIEGKKAIAVDSPTVWGDGDCMTDHGIAHIAGQYVAYVVGDGRADEVTLDAAVWNGKAFDPGKQLVMRFDHVLTIDGSACAGSKGACDDFAKLAMSAATRYDRSPQKGVLDTAFAPYDKAAYAALVKAARGPGGPLEKDGQPPELPLLEDTGKMAGFSSDAEVFPLVFRGETLLGLIDHGHVGWRENNDWLVAAWRLKNGKPEAAAAAYISVNRDKLLLAAPVPEPPAETH